MYASEFVCLSGMNMMHVHPWMLVLSWWDCMVVVSYRVELGIVGPMICYVAYKELSCSGEYHLVVFIIERI